MLKEAHCSKQSLKEKDNRDWLLGGFLQLHRGASPFYYGEIIPAWDEDNVDLHC